MFDVFLQSAWKQLSSEAQNLQVPHTFIDFSENLKKTIREQQKSPFFIHLGNMQIHISKKIITFVTN